MTGWMPGLIQSSARSRFRPALRHCQQRRDVVHYRPYASPDRAEPSQAQQVHGGGAQRPGDVAAVANLVMPCHKRDLALSLAATAGMWRGI